MLTLFAQSCCECPIFVPRILPPFNARPERFCATAIAARCQVKSTGYSFRFGLGARFNSVTRTSIFTRVNFSHVRSHDTSTPSFAVLSEVAVNVTMRVFV